jgi:excisionase family DNA binding protein
MNDQQADILSRIAELLSRREATWPRWLTIKRAAEYSGLSAGTVRRMLSAGRLEAHRPARGRVLIDRMELDSVIAGATTAVRVGRGRSNGTMKCNKARAAVARGQIEGA